MCSPSKTLPADEGTGLTVHIPLRFLFPVSGPVRIVVTLLVTRVIARLLVVRTTAKLSLSC